MADVSLEIVEGPGAGQQVELTGPIEIGRDQSAGLVLDDDLVSRRHVRVTPADGGAVAEDLGSSNGTFVNGEEIHLPTQLSPGDHLLVGVTVVELRSAAQVADSPTAVRPRPAALAAPPPLAIPEREPDYVPREVAAAERQERPGGTLDALRDTHTKSKAATAPIAIFILVVFVVLIYLATR
jgi:pSer/pThr/pTyr-binding forkhead associated (FHA) protein